MSDEVDMPRKPAETDKRGMKRMGRDAGGKGKKELTIRSSCHLLLIDMRALNKQFNMKVVEWKKNKNTIAWNSIYRKCFYILYIHPVCAIVRVVDVIRCYTTNCSYSISISKLSLTILIEFVLWRKRSRQNKTNFLMCEIEWSNKDTWTISGKAHASKRFPANLHVKQIEIQISLVSMHNLKRKFTHFHMRFCYQNIFSSL